MAQRAPRNVEKKSIASGGDLGEIAELKRRIHELEEAVDSLRGCLLRKEDPERVIADELARSPRALTVKYVPSTSDGWLLVMISGSRNSLPSGLSVSVTSQAGGRDYGVVSEGVFSGATFDVKAGNLVNGFDRTSKLEVRFAPATGGAVVLDGIKYEHELVLTFSEGGTSKTLGPYPAKTDSSNPVPSGVHDLEIADYPHALGSSYGSLGTVWFRIGHTGDRYVHPGRISAGCVTCAPKNWGSIYGALNVGRVGDGLSVGKLTVA